MIWTLWRYIARDLLINFSLSLVGLTSVLALAGVLVRMRQEGLDSQRILLLFAYLVPVMLTVTLPFASLFSATLVYGRMSSTNEINACRAGGISVGKLMYPALLLSMITGGSSVYMAMYLIPRYTREVEVILRRDIERVVMAKMRSRGTAMLQGHGRNSSRLFADWADPEGGRPRMKGVLAILDSNDRERQIMTADSVELAFAQETGALSLKLTGSWGTPPNRQYNADGVVMETTLPPQFSEKVKFRDLDGLLALTQNPTDDPEVRGAIANFVFQRTFSDFFAEMHRNFGPGTLGMRTFHAEKVLSEQAEIGSEGLCYRIRSAAAVERAGTTAILRDVTLEVFPRGYDNAPDAAPGYRFYRGGYLSIIPVWTGASDFWSLRMRLDGVSEARERNGDSMTDVPIRTNHVTVDRVEMVPRSPNFRTLDFGQVYRWDLDKVPANDAVLVSASERIENSVRLINLHIAAELHSRLAMGICCLLFVFLGAGLGVLSKSGDYVVALAISAAPGALTLGVIVLGRRVLINMDNPFAGVLTIWGGPFLLLVANALLYRYLLRR